MTLLVRVYLDRPFRRQAARRSWARGAANRPEESYRMASLFAKENLAVPRIAVEPAGDEREMLTEFIARGGRGRRGGVLSIFSGRGRYLEIVLKDVLCGTRLAGDFGEA